MAPKIFSMPNALKKATEKKMPDRDEGNVRLSRREKNIVYRFRGKRFLEKLAKKSP